MSSANRIDARLRPVRGANPSQGGARAGVPETAPRPFGQRGMSLVEVLVATALLGGALLSLCSLFFLGMRNNMAAKHDTVMVAYIQDKMEWLKQLSVYDLADIQSECESTGNPMVEYYVEGVGWTDTPPAGAMLEYRREWEVHDLVLNTNVAYPDGFNNNVVKAVTVRCFSYKYKKGPDPRSIEITTLRRIN